MRRATMIEIGLAAGVIVAAIVFGTFVQSGGLRDGLIRLSCIGLFAVSLNLLVGYTGMLSFGHALFYALGAYAFALMLQSGAVGIPLAAFAALGLVAAAAVVIGSVAVRLTHVYFAFITLAIQMLFYSLLIAWSDLTGGEQGLIGGVPVPPFLGINLRNPTHYFIFNVTILSICLLILRRIVTSPFGAALRMIRDNPQRAVFLGMDVFRMRLVAFVIASAFAGVAGILMSLYVSGAYPNFSYWTVSGEGLFMIMLGGVNAFLGPLVGAALLLALEMFVNAYTSHHGIFIGAFILLAALGLRKGLLDFVVEAMAARRERRLDAGGSTGADQASVAAGKRLAAKGEGQ